MFEKEIQRRSKFNTSAIKYLPPALHPVLAMNPIKHEIFPTQNASPLMGLSVDDEELFGKAQLEIAQSEIAQQAGVKIIKTRTTTL